MLPIGLAGGGPHDRVGGDWDSRYRKLGVEVGKATDVLVTALSGTLQAPGLYALRHGTPITIAAIAHLIGWVAILAVEEP